MSAEQEINAALENLYRGSGAIYAFQCSNPYCDERERPDLKLKWCSRCNAVPYCSATCQRADWKTHKKHCTAHPHFLRACTFAEKFEDLFSELLYACLTTANGAWKGDERAVFVTLAELPSSYERPRFEIEEIRIEPMPDDASSPPGLARKLRSTRELGTLTFCFPKTKNSHDSPGAGDDFYDTYTEKFDIEEYTHPNNGGAEFFNMFSHRDPNWYKDFINQLARGKTPV